jgi:hypothetical protein
MRLLLEILVIACLVFLGWRQPLRDQVRETFPSLGIAPSRLSIVNREAQHARSAPRQGAAPAAPAGAWKWEPGKLDRPTK